MSRRQRSSDIPDARFLVYLVTINAIPAYVGKAGRPDRIAVHWRKARDLNARLALGLTPPVNRWLQELARAIRAGDSIVVNMLAEHLTSNDAFQVERANIAKFGRRGVDLAGVLYNSTPGGEGVPPEIMARIANTEQWRKRAGEQMRRLNADPEFKQAHHERLKRRFEDPAEVDKVKRVLGRFAHDPAHVAIRTARATQRRRELRADPIYASKLNTSIGDGLRRHFADPAVAAAHKARMQHLHSQPDFIGKMIAGVRKAQATRLWRERYDAGMRNRSEGGSFAAKVRAGVRERMKDPQFAAEQSRRGRQQVMKLHANPEFRAANAARMAARNQDPTFVAKRIAALRAANAKHPPRNSVRKPRKKPSDS